MGGLRCTGNSGDREEILGGLDVMDRQGWGYWWEKNERDWKYDGREGMGTLECDGNGRRMRMLKYSCA